MKIKSLVLLVLLIVIAMSLYTFFKPLPEDKKTKPADLIVKKKQVVDTAHKKQVKKSFQNIQNKKPSIKPAAKSSPQEKNDTPGIFDITPPPSRYDEPTTPPPALHNPPPHDGLTPE